MNTGKTISSDNFHCMTGAEWYERAPSRRLVLEDDLQGVLNQRDNFANAIGEAIVNAGIVEPGIAMTGPELIQTLADLVDHYKQLAAAKA